MTNFFSVLFGLLGEVRLVGGDDLLARVGDGFLLLWRVMGFGEDAFGGLDGE